VIKLELKSYPREEIATIYGIDLKDNQFARKIKRNLEKEGYNYIYSRKETTITKLPIPKEKETTIDEVILEIKEDVSFWEDWLSLDKYNFKILTIATILANENRAYCGTLEKFCEEIGVVNNQENIKKIKRSLKFLYDSGHIDLKILKEIYTIILTPEARKDNNIIKIKKAWYELIRENSIGVSWENVLKVFLVIYDELDRFDNETLATNLRIAYPLGIKEKTVGRCMKIIESIDFGDFKIRSKIVIKKKLDGEYQCLGKEYKKEKDKKFINSFN